MNTKWHALIAGKRLDTIHSVTDAEVNVNEKCPYCQTMNYRVIEEFHRNGGMGKFKKGELVDCDCGNTFEKMYNKYGEFSHFENNGAKI